MGEVEEEAQQRLQQHNAKSQAAKKGRASGEVPGARGTPARRPGSSGQLPATPRTPAGPPTGAPASELPRGLDESIGPMHSCRCQMYSRAVRPSSKPRKTTSPSPTCCLHRLDLGWGCMVSPG